MDHDPRRRSFARAGPAHKPARAPSLDVCLDSRGPFIDVFICGLLPYTTNDSAITVHYRDPMTKLRRPSRSLAVSVVSAGCSVTFSPGCSSTSRRYLPGGTCTV